mmetsp:Transcript_1184/g.3760  ORF Transcript_1184/g.3760 Transcript_1184/m.3760 type:complete len:211 (-) Transcript_1184:803-1435(-)
MHARPPPSSHHPACRQAEASRVSKRARGRAGHFLASAAECDRAALVPQFSTTAALHRSTMAAEVLGPQATASTRPGMAARASLRASVYCLRSPCGTPTGAPAPQVYTPPPSVRRRRWLSPHATPTTGPSSLSVPGRGVGSKNLLKPQTSTVLRSRSTKAVPWSDAPMSTPSRPPPTGSASAAAPSGTRGTSIGSSCASKADPELRNPPTS